MNINTIEWSDPYHGRAKPCIVFYGDGSIEIESAPESILITDELLCKLPLPGIVRDGPFIVIKGTNKTVCYELMEQSPESCTWYAELRKIFDETNGHNT